MRQIVLVADRGRNVRVLNTMDAPLVCRMCLAAGAAAALPSGHDGPSL